MGHRRLNHEEGCSDVCRKQPGPDIGRDVGQRVKPQDPSDIAEHIKSPESLDRSRHGLCAIGRITEVSGIGNAFAARFGNAPARLNQAVMVEIDQTHSRAFSRKTDACRTAEAPQ